MSRVLDEVRVASPCGVSWDDMIGTDRVRYCHHCRLNVYNLSAMGREDAEAMVQRREGRLCVRFYRRADGTMITQDCPVGLRSARWAIHRGWVLLTASLASVMAIFMGVAAVAPSPGRGQSLRCLEPFASILEFISPSATDSTPAASPVVVPPPTAPICIMGEMAPPPAKPPVQPEPDPE